MTVKELFHSVNFSEIVKTLKLKSYKNNLLPISEYKENYDIICNLEGSGQGNPITFKVDGSSDTYKIEGCNFKNIVGREVILPDNDTNSKIEAAAEILWCSGPFGRTTEDEWDAFFDELINPAKGDYYSLQAKRVDILISLPYCRNKAIRRELKREMKSPYADLCLSADASSWFLLSNHNNRRKRQNRSKRKREYRLKKRYEQLLKLKEINHDIELLKSQIGSVPEHIKKLLEARSSMETLSFQSQTFGKGSRIDYLSDLLLNPIYESNKYLDEKRKQVCICIIYSSSEYPLTEVERKELAGILSSYFKATPWELFEKESRYTDKEIGLDIMYLTF